MWLNFLYTVQLVISDVCTKFQNSRSSSAGEIFDKNFHMHYLEVKDRKEKIEKEGKIKSRHLGLFTLIHLVVLIVFTKFEDCSTHRC